MDETLKIQEMDFYFAEELAQEPGCQHLRRCFTCGMCTATCPVAEIEAGFSPSRIIRQILYGMKVELLASPSLWHCLGCARCSFTCPQDVRFLDVIQGLRNLARRSGAVSPGLAASLDRADHLLQDLRRRLVTALLAAPPDEADPKALLARLLTEAGESPEKEG